MTISKTADHFRRHIGGLLDECPVGLAVVTREPDKGLNPGQRIFANETLARMFGFPSVETFTAEPIQESWVDQSRLAEFEGYIERGEAVVNFEALRRRRDGSTWWALLSTHAAEFDGDAYTLVWHVDISERKQAEAELRFRGEIFDNMAEGVVVVEQESKTLVYTNSVFETIFGYDEGEMIGLPVAAVNAPTEESPEEVYRRILSNIEATGSWAGEIKNRRKDGSDFWCFVNVTSFDHAVFGKCNVSVHTDITERKDAEASLISANQALTKEIEQHRKTERSLREAMIAAEAGNRAKIEFLANMSHELRTPLNAIIGFSEMMNREVFGPLGSSKYREYSDNIMVSSRHLLDLVNDVLDLSTIEAAEHRLHLEEFAVGEVVEECVNVVTKAAMDKDITPVVSVNDAIPSLNADRRAVTQILLNLLSNAIKFTPDGGSVSLIAKAVNGNHIFEVIDTGRGVRADNLSTITEPFARMDSDPHISQQGTGLGLAIVKSLVELHQGKLHIESEVGTGTSVRVTLPTAPA